jgi:hypothetical protein
VVQCRSELPSKTASAPDGFVVIWKAASDAGGSVLGAVATGMGAGLEALGSGRGVTGSPGRTLGGADVFSGAVVFSCAAAGAGTAAEAEAALEVAAGAPVALDVVAGAAEVAAGFVPVPLGF